MGMISEAWGWLTKSPRRQADVRAAQHPGGIIPGAFNAPELCMLPSDLDTSGRRGNAPWPFDEPCWMQLKGDGLRALALGAGRIVTREGNPLDVALHCVPALQRLEAAYGEPMFFDGEYIEADGYDATMAAFKRGEGTGVFWIFDAFPLSQWEADDCTWTIEERLQRLMELWPVLESPFVGVLQPMKVETGIMAESMVRDLWRRQYEGAVFKAAGTMYRRRRHPAWVRWKETITVDCPVIDVLKKKDGTFQALMVRGPEGAPIRVGSGFPESLKARLAVMETVGLHAEITYNRKAGCAKARHARFVRLRFDKGGDPHA